MTETKRNFIIFIIAAVIVVGLVGYFFYSRLKLFEPAIPPFLEVEPGTEQLLQSLTAPAGQQVISDKELEEALKSLTALEGQKAVSSEELEEALRNLAPPQ
jgi:hypothetical protein